MLCRVPNCSSRCTKSMKSLVKSLGWSIVLIAIFSGRATEHAARHGVSIVDDVSIGFYQRNAPTCTRHVTSCRSCRSATSLAWKPYVADSSVSSYSSWAVVIQ